MPPQQPDSSQAATQPAQSPCIVPSFISCASSYFTNTPSRAGLVNRTMAACPNTLLTLSGYSQGAQVVHNTIPMLPASTTAKLSSVVLFGDPKNGTAIPNIDMAKVLTVCHKGDDICKGGDEIGIQHLSYSLDAGLAADWGMFPSFLGFFDGRREHGKSSGLLCCV
jgi:cutinase